jgi:hypothetical protein
MMRYRFEVGRLLLQRRDDGMARRRFHRMSMEPNSLTTRSTIAFTCSFVRHVRLDRDGPKPMSVSPSPSSAVPGCGVTQLTHPPVQTPGQSPAMPLPPPVISIILALNLMLPLVCLRCVDSATAVLLHATMLTHAALTARAWPRALNPVDATRSRRSRRARRTPGTRLPISVTTS